MVTNYYNASNNFSAPIRKEPKPFSPERHGESLIEEPKESCEMCTEESLLSACGNENAPTVQKNHTLLRSDPDTLVLLALLWILLVSDSRDRLLEIALIYLLLS